MKHLNVILTFLGFFSFLQPVLASSAAPTIVCDQEIEAVPGTVLSPFRPAHMTQYTDQTYQINRKLEYIKSHVRKGRAQAMAYGELFFSTKNDNVGRACIAYYKERYTGEYEGRRYLDDGDVKTLIDIMENGSPVVSRKAYYLVKEFIRSAPVNHTRRTYLYKGSILYAPNRQEKHAQLDNLRNYYLEFLQSRYVFRQEDLRLLESMAFDEKNGIYRSSFTALLTYINITDKEQRYFNHLKWKDPSNAVIYEYMQCFVDDYFCYARNKIFISSNEFHRIANYYYKSSLDPRAKWKLLFLNDFLRKWYSVPVGSSGFMVPLSTYK